MKLHTLFRGLAAGSAAMVGLLSLTTAPASAIVGGTDATHLYGSVTIEADRDGDGIFAPVCGGSLRSYRGITVVETTAHCVTPPGQSTALDPTRVRLSVGSRRPDAGTIIASRSITVAPGWAWATQPAGQPVADIAIIKPAKQIALPALPLSSARPAATVRALGSGVTDPAGDGPPATILQQRDVKILPASDCAGALIGPDELCVAPAACKGDGGYPAVIRQHHRWATLGGASRGTGGCTAPSVYTNYAAWDTWAKHVILTEPSPSPTVAHTAPLAGTDASSHLQWFGA